VAARSSAAVSGSLSIDASPPGGLYRADGRDSREGWGGGLLRRRCEHLGKPLNTWENPTHVGKPGTGAERAEGHREVVVDQQADRGVDAVEGWADERSQQAQPAQHGRGTCHTVLRAVKATDRKDRWMLLTGARYRVECVGSWTDRGGDRTGRYPDF
jgi:hypothetical protein